MSKNHIVSYFPDTDLRSGHFGLGVLAKLAGKAASTLGQGEFIVFVNRRQSAMKLLAAHNVLVHVKAPTEAGRLDLRTIKFIPKYFNGTSFNYKKALAEVLEKDFRRKTDRRL